MPATRIETSSAAVRSARTAGASYLPAVWTESSPSPRTKLAVWISSGRLCKHRFCTCRLASPSHILNCSSNTEAPYCKTDIIHDDDELQGYSLYICDTNQAAEVILRHTRGVVTPSPFTPTTTLPSQGTRVVSVSPSPDYYNVPVGASLSSSAIIGISVGSLGK